MKVVCVVCGRGGGAPRGVQGAAGHQGSVDVGGAITKEVPVETGGRGVKLQYTM